MRLGFGVGTIDMGFTGGVSDAADGGLSSAAFLAAYGPYGMVMDFTDASISINDSADTLDYSSQGTVSSTTGALLGPGSKLTNTAPSAKLTEQADGYLAFQAHNLMFWSEDMTNAVWTKTGTTAPDFETVNVTAGNSAHIINQVRATSVIQGGTYTAEVEVSDITQRYVSLNVSDNAAHGVGVVVDMQTGLITASVVLGTLYAAVTSSVTDAGSGWWRVSLTYTTTATPTTTTLGLFARPDGTNTTWLPTYNSTGASFKARKAHTRRAPSVSTYVATTSAAVYDLPYVYSGGVKTGIMVEPAATNLCLRSNDLTNASWTKSNMTTALTATGPDGVANSASTLTATAGNATALQAITSGSSSRLTHCYIKRRTGSGNIDLTQDNGTTWTTVTVTSAWARVEIAAVTSTNPTVGIRIVTSGDAVDVAYFQHETGTVATSPIITYGSSVVRAVDTDTSLLNLFPSLGSAYTMYIRYKPASASVATTALRLDDTTANELVSIGNNASGQGLATVTDGGVSQASITDGTITSSAFHRLAVSVEANNVLFVVNGGTGVQDTSVSLPTLTRMLLGNTSGQLITQIALFPGARTEAQLQAIGA